MSREVYALLLKKKIGEFNTNNQKKKYLLKCVGKFRNLSTDEPSHKILSLHDMAQGSFIEPGTMTIKYFKDGKEYQRDLATISTWQNVPPEYQKSVKTSVDIIEVIKQLNNINVKEESIRNIITLWHNVLIYNPEIRGEQKKAMQVLCIYYGLKMNKIEVNLHQIAGAFDTTKDKVLAENPYMISIFSKTKFEKYISSTLGQQCSINIGKRFTDKMELIKNDFKSNGFELHEPVPLREYSGMVFFLHKEFKAISRLDELEKKLTVDELAKNCTISVTNIRSSAKTFESFYKKFPILKKRILL